MFILLLTLLIAVYISIAIAITKKFFIKCEKPLEEPSEKDDDTHLSPNSDYPFPSAIPREYLKATNDRYLKIYAPTNPLRGLSVGVNIDDAFYGRRVPYSNVQTPFREVGIVTSITHSGSTSDLETNQYTYKLLKRDIDPLRDWYEYQVYDFKNDLMIPLGMNYTYLEDGDVIHRIAGKESKGSFKVRIFDKYNYIYV